MADIVGQDDPVAADVERLAGAIELIREGRREELLAGAAGAVEHHHRIVDLPRRVAVRLAERGIMDPHAGEALARSERDITEGRIMLADRPGGGGRGAGVGDRHRGRLCRRGGGGQQREQRGEDVAQADHRRPLFPIYIGGPRRA